MAISAASIVALSRLLDEAMDLPPDALEPWLAALPPDRAVLVPELRQVLAERTRAGEFMAAGPTLVSNDGSVANAGEPVGPYRLIREIGRGGMGAVWLAQRAHGGLKRNVALKLPRLAWGAGLAERMARERDIGALLEHPNIARLYDAGVDDKGRPYLAMEFVDGVPLDEWRNSGARSLPDRLRLFQQVARAVAYAHGRLIVHRDLKPSNVLVTPDGQVHLLDFGIAKLLDEASPSSPLTEEHGRVMTPRYASPEQITGATLSVASDIYSLGVLLFEILTGASPYATTRTSAAAIEEAILAGEVPLASSMAVGKDHARALRGELDAIVAHALKRDPAARYPTADALAQDVGRYLAGERVLAQPDSFRYRVVRNLRRHRTAFAAGGAVLLAVVGGATASLMQARRANGEAERARIVKEFVVDVFRVNESGAANAQLRELPAAQLLDRGAQLIETKFPHQPALQAELFGVVAGIYDDMGASYPAVRYASRQVELLAASGASRDEQARAQILLAQTLLADGRLEEGRLAAERALARSVGDAALRARSQVLLARALFELGRYDAAASTLDALDRMSPPGGTATATHARALLVRALLAEKSIRIEEALTLLRSAAAEGRAAEGEFSPSAIDAGLREAVFLATERRFEEATKVGQQALVILRASGPSGEIRALREEARFVRSVHRAGGMSSTDMRNVFDRLVKDATSRGGTVPESIRAWIDFDYASAMLVWGDVQTATPQIEKSVASLRPITQALFRQETLAAYRGHALMFSGRHREAEAELNERLASEKFEYQTMNPRVLISYVYAAINLDMEGKFVEARELLASAPQVTHTQLEAVEDSSRIIPTASARIAMDSGDARLALALLPTGENEEPNNPFLIFDSMEVRGEVLCALGRRAEGLALLDRVLVQYAKEDYYEYDPEGARTRAVAGLCALADGDRKRASELAALAHAAFTVQPAVSPYFKAPSIDLDRQLAALPIVSPSRR